MKVFIKNTNPELSYLVIPVLEMLGGANKSGYSDYSRHIYYIEENSYNIDITANENLLLKKGYIEIDLKKLNNLFNPKPNNVFPKVMRVWNNNTQHVTRVVIGINPINNKYLAITRVETIKEAIDNKYLGVAEWDYIEDIIENPIIELSLEEISNKFNIPIESIRIKK